MKDSTASTAAPTGCTCADARSEADLKAAIDDLVAKYRDKPGGLIPALQTAQALCGYLPEGVIRAIADGFGRTVSEVTGVVTFYSFFTLHPRGRHLIRVCLGTACYVRGGKDVLEALKKNLSIDVGETTPDRLFSLEVGRCFGACGMAPVVMVDDTLHQRVKPARIGDLIKAVLADDESDGTEKKEEA